MERATDIFADQRRPLGDEQGKQVLEIEILKKAGSLVESMRERNGR
jgi:hypothetical protein